MGGEDKHACMHIDPIQTWLGMLTRLSFDMMAMIASSKLPAGRVPEPEFRSVETSFSRSPRNVGRFDDDVSGGDELGPWGAPSSGMKLWRT